MFENYSFIDLSIIITYFAVILWISRKVYKGKNNLGVSKVVSVDVEQAMELAQS